MRQFVRFRGCAVPELPEVETIVRDAGLTVRRSYVYGEIPNRTARAFDLFLPRAGYKVLKDVLSYGMGTVVLGER